MTARSKKRRNKNSAIRRVKHKAKEVQKLKKMLGFIEEDAGELMDKLKDITVQKEKQNEKELLKKEALEELRIKETKDTINHDRFVTVVHPKTKVKHRYNVRTKRDQFGQCPVWHNPRKERHQKRIREGKAVKKRQFRGRRLHFIDKRSAWKAIV